VAVNRELVGKQRREFFVEGYVQYTSVSVSLSLVTVHISDVMIVVVVVILIVSIVVTMNIICECDRTFAGTDFICGTL